MTQITSHDYHGGAHVFDESDYIAHVSVYAVHVVEGAVLMVKDTNSGRWELPGGGVEEGESEFEALRREVNEETGLNSGPPSELIKEFEEYYYDLPTKQPWRSMRKFYLIPDLEGEILADGNGDDTMAVRMINIAEINHLKITDTLKTVILSVLKGN